MLAPESRDDDLGEGVVYAPGDCASFARRVLIALIDFFVLAIIYVALVIAVSIALPFHRDSILLAFVLWLMVVFVYFVFIEPSRFGTLGYLLTGVKVVNLKGDKPSSFRMAFRLLLWSLGPIHPVVDFFWIFNDRYKQTLRDKIAGTYVVRKRALPSRFGRIRGAQLFLFGFALQFPEVQKSERALERWNVALQPADSDAIMIQTR